MTTPQQPLPLPGCNSQVLASYLKALGVHRLVAEQADSQALASWDNAGMFHLTSSLDREALLAFFLERYSPSPIVTPWNGGSGFYPKDQQAGISAMEQSSASRFETYRKTISACREALGNRGEKPRDDDKLELLLRLRRCLPDPALQWIDTAYVVFDEDARYPALLGTGGNDGRLDFANNFMQRLAEMLLSPPKKKRGGGTASPAEQLGAALFGDNTRPGVLQSMAVGQFSPAAAGGVNMSSGIEGSSRVNPWDYILMLEGALLFAGAAVRRLETGRFGSAAFPFHVRSSAVGYGSAADADQDRQNSRGEIWLPVWSAPTSLAELSRLFGEGRLDVGRRRATSGLDAARALASLGVDRGISRFERFGFLRRNGLSFLATYLGSLSVRERRLPHVDLLEQLDELLDGAERADRPEVGAALRILKTAIFEACRQEQLPLTDVLAAAGTLERTIARSAKLHDRLRPCKPLASAWYEAAMDGSVEFAVAAAVASWDIRPMWEPYDPARSRFTELKPLWGDGDVFDNILSVARRRLLEREEVGLIGRSALSGTHLGWLLNGQSVQSIDRRRMEALIFGLSLLKSLAPMPEPTDSATINPIFAVLRAVTSPRYLPTRLQDRHPAPRLIQNILAQLAAGDLTAALEVASRRLRGSGISLKVQDEHLLGAAPLFGDDLRPLATALVLPLPQHTERRLIEGVVLPAVVQRDAPSPISQNDTTETPHA